MEGLDDLDMQGAEKENCERRDKGLRAFRVPAIEVWEREEGMYATERADEWVEEERRVFEVMRPVGECDKLNKDSSIEW